MNKTAFSKIAQSLRQYRRAELRDFSSELGPDPVSELYVDPLPDDAVLKSVMSSNTTFLLGRKGTGKSTIFAKAQIEYRKSRDVLSAYVDVKALSDLLSSDNLTLPASADVDAGICSAHLLRKAFLGQVLSELLKEIDKTCENVNMVERWRGAKRPYNDLRKKLGQVRQKVANPTLEAHEIPVLQQISTAWRQQKRAEQGRSSGLGAGASVRPTGAQMGISASMADFDRAVDDVEVYKQYSQVVIQAFPFAELLDDIQNLLDGANMSRLVVFFDDFSEMDYVEQRLFVDVILAPLNNSSNERIKIKIAGYPGRIYYGRIDPAKVDTIAIDFSALYEAENVQEMEASAVDYATRLLRRRFQAFDADIGEFFDPTTSLDEHMRHIFQASFNVPRLMGILLHQCYLDRISKGQQITPAAIRLAARKTYEATISQYFDRMLRFALEPFENKLDRHNQKGLLDYVIAEARAVRKKIQEGAVGGTYFQNLGNPPTSHFLVQPSLESVFRSLEANFLITRYKEMRDKNGNHVIVYALNYGLVEANRMSWGYPAGREYRNYFVQRCFDYSRAIQEFLGQKQTIRCEQCLACFPMENHDGIKMFDWLCPGCKQGKCQVGSDAKLRAW